MSILWITLAVLAGAFIVGGTAVYFLRARFVETMEATASNLQSMAAPVPVAEEVRAIGDQIERAMTESRLQGETQRQLLVQKLDSVRQSVETQRTHVDGIRNELRHEIRRRDVEISEIKSQISTISSTIGLPAHTPAQAALPPAASDETPETPPAPVEAPAIPALADPALTPCATAPPVTPPADSGSLTPPHDVAPEALEPDADEPDSFEPMSFEPVSFASIHPAAPVEAPDYVDEPIAPFQSPEDALPVAMPVEDFDVAPPFVIDPVGDAERDAADAAGSGWAAPDAPVQPEDGWESATAPEPPADALPEPLDAEAFSFVDVPLAATPAMPAAAPDEPAAVQAPAPFDVDDLSGDSFAEVSFQDVSFSATSPPAAPPAPSPPAPEATAPPDPTEEVGASFASWPPAAPSEVPAPVHLPPPAPAATPPPTTSAETLGPWVARPARDDDGGSAFSFGEPVHASASDFLPNPGTRPAPEPEASPEPAPALEPEATAPPAPEPHPVPEIAPAPEPTPAPDHADDLTAISSIDADVQRLLYAEGIHTLDQIAQMTRTTARRVSAAVQVSEETIMTQWVFEAQSALFTPFATGGRP